MNSYARSISLSAALLVATVLGVLVTAEPPQQPAQQARPIAKVLGPAVAPISMSDPDGQDLILEELSARTAIQGMLSLTELEFRFRNPQNRRIEGRFSCTLPPNAAISRFAKEVNGQLMEGEVVERLRANQVYEQFLHQMRDPALLEQDQGNRFSARIFPIDANQSVRLVLSYTTLLPMKSGVRTYSLPLRGLSKIGRFSFRAFVTALPGEESTTSTKSSVEGPSGASRSTAEVISLDERDYAPPADIVLSWRPTSAASRARVLRAGDFYVAAFRPEVRSLSTLDSRGGWLFYVDTSASSAEGAEHRIRALETLLSALPAQDRVQVNAFDQDVVTLVSGSASEVARSIGDRLRTRLFLGGTDLGTLLADVAKNAQQQPDRAIVVASDLVATLGRTERKDVTDAIRAISPKATIHVLILGSRQESAIAKSLTAGRGRIVTIPFTDAIDARASEAVTELRKPIGQTFETADSAAEWMYPTHFDDVQDGDEIIVLGKLKAGGVPAARLVSGGDLAASEAALPTGTFGPLLEREAYRAYLEYLAEREANEPAAAVRRALATEQVKISVEQRVVIPRTTMLVLESEWDYQRFGLDRRALAAILAIEAGGIGRIDRHTNQPVPISVPVPPPMRVGSPTAPRKTAAVPQPSPAATAAPDEGRLEGGVEGGVVGGVVGGVIGGTVGNAPTGAVAESITVTSAVVEDAVQESVAATASPTPMRDQPPMTFRSPP
ncbi:MAG TPA: VIT domain-containing protein, partial [Thermoanaerobaculia bacterium]|nr:VIT domain-containing protein [Thermoanaerobaculia bacterium]